MAIKVSLRREEQETTPGVKLELGVKCDRSCERTSICAAGGSPAGEPASGLRRAFQEPQEQGRCGAWGTDCRTRSCVAAW